MIYDLAGCNDREYSKIATPSESGNLLGRMYGRKPYRVKHWTTPASAEEAKLKDFSPGIPYAQASVGSPLLPDKGKMPATHRVDLLTTPEIFEDTGVEEHEEVLAIHASASFLRLP